MGEYGLTNSLMKRGYNIDTLMAKYRNVSAWVLALPEGCMVCLFVQDRVTQCRGGTGAGVRGRACVSL